MLDPVQAAFNIGALIRWVDYNDAFYGATVIHPSVAALPVNEFMDLLVA